MQEEERDGGGEGAEERCTGEGRRGHEECDCRASGVVCACAVGARGVWGCTGAGAVSDREGGR
jgi:hypothetical protein